jgi:hypothetical protein
VPKNAFLIIAYARSTVVSRLLSVLVANGVKDIFIAIDYPKTSQVELKQIEMLNAIQKISKDNSLVIHVWKRKYNQGSGAAVISAIDWFFSHVEQGVILEDDLVVEADFIRYMELTLSAYKNSPDVIAVSGSNPFAENLPKDLGFVVNYPVAWGWGTWANKWLEIRTMIFSDGIGLKGYLHPILFSFWQTGKRRALSGKIDAWDIPLASSMYSSNKITIISPVNLVSNIGSDIHSSHTTKSQWPLHAALGKLPSNWMPTAHIPQLLNLNKMFERQIFGVKPIRIFSYPTSIIFDFFRFSSRGIKLIDRINLEPLPNEIKTKES